MLELAPDELLMSLWERSGMNIVASEFRNFPRRIVAILRIAEPQLGVRLPQALWGHSRAHLYPVNSFLLACSDYIQDLQRQVPWCGHLEAQLAVRAFEAGARWGVSNDNEKHIGGTP